MKMENELVKCWRRSGEGGEAELDNTQCRLSLPIDGFNIALQTLTAVLPEKDVVRKPRKNVDLPAV